MMSIVTDADVATLSPSTAVRALRDAVRAAHRGELAAPPRAVLDLGDAALKITAGRAGDWFGYRSYHTGDLADADQLVVLHDAGSGAVVAVCVGDLIGQYRTGALGGVAVDALARPDAATLGLVGTGRQAFAQAWAIRAVRRLTDVAVYGRDARRREAFAARLRDELDLPARPVGSAEPAVRDRDLVVLATNSGTPVVDPAWVAPGTAVTTLGPKQRGWAEFGPELAERADLIVTDSVAQLHAYEPPSVLAGTPVMERVRPLGAVLDDPPPTGDAIRLYLSVGLAGTEPALLAAVLDG